MNDEVGGVNSKTTEYSPAEKMVRRIEIKKEYPPKNNPSLDDSHVNNQVDNGQASYEEIGQVPSSLNENRIIPDIYSMPEPPSVVSYPESVASSGKNGDISSDVLDLTVLTPAQSPPIQPIVMQPSLTQLESFPDDQSKTEDDMENGLKQRTTQLPTERKKYRSKFCESYLSDRRLKSWVRRVSNDPYRAKCIMCDTTLNCGRHVLYLHMTRKSHVINQANFKQGLSKPVNHTVDIKQEARKFVKVLKQQNFNLGAPGNLESLIRWVSRDLLPDNLINNLEGTSSQIKSPETPVGE